MDYILTDRNKRGDAAFSSAVYEELRCLFGDLVEDCRVRDGMLTVLDNTGVRARVSARRGIEYAVKQAAAIIRSGGAL